MIDIENQIHQLRMFTEAYPEDMFAPLSEDEIKAHSEIVSRSSATMGRHCAKIFAQAADTIGSLQSELAALRKEMEEARKAGMIEAADLINNIGDYCGGHGEPRMPSPSDCAKVIREAAARQQKGSEDEKSLAGHVCKFEQAIDLKTLEGWQECSCGKKRRGGVPYYRQQTV